MTMSHIIKPISVVNRHAGVTIRVFDPKIIQNYENLCELMELYANQYKLLKTYANFSKQMQTIANFCKPMKPSEVKCIELH